MKELWGKLPSSICTVKYKHTYYEGNIKKKNQMKKNQWETRGHQKLLVVVVLKVLTRLLSLLTCNTILIRFWEKRRLTTGKTFSE